MPIVVDKAQKRKEIALACKEMLVQKSIQAITISEIAKVAGIGKGTFYEYFKDKEELVFEIVNLLMQEHNRNKEAKLAASESTREKIKIFYSFFYDDASADLRALYREFIAYALFSPKEEMIAFQTECFRFYYRWVEKIIDEGIAKGELLPIAKEFIKGMYTMGEGMFVASLATEGVIDLKRDINAYVDHLFDLVEQKEY